MVSTREQELLNKEYLTWQERDELVASILKIATKTFSEMSTTAKLGAIVNFMFWETNRVDLILVGPGNVLCSAGGSGEGSEKYRGRMAMPENAAAVALIELVKRRPKLIR